MGEYSLVPKPEKEKIKVAWYLLYAYVSVVPGKHAWGSAPVSYTHLTLPTNREV